MCQSCWVDAGCPNMDTPGIRAALPVLKEYEEVCGSGGACHIIVDDWNVEDSHLIWCGSEKGGRRFSEGQEERAVTDRLIEAMMPLSVPERYSLLALDEGLWPYKEELLKEDAEATIRCSRCNSRLRGSLSSYGGLLIDPCGDCEEDPECPTK